jgi:hypothetical protein
MLSAMVKDWMVAEEWNNMDEAIFSVNKLKPLNGAYWFWLMSDYDNNNPRMLQVLISRGPFDYKLNNKRFINKQIDDERFDCYCGVWQYKDGKLTDLIHDNCTCIVTNNEFSCVTESGYEILISKSFPYYDMLLKNEHSEVTRFKSISTKFNGEYMQNPLVKYPSRIAFSEDFDAYARNSRGFQYFLASKMSDLFGTCQGELFDKVFDGSFWLERAFGFGSTLPWKIVMVNFSDKSRLWYRYFPSKILNYGAPLEFIFDDITTKKRYHLNEMTFHYTGPDQGPTKKFSDGVETINVTGKGELGERISIISKILGRHLYQYSIAGINFNYNQLVLEIENIEFEANGINLMKDKQTTLSYGEDAYFSL